MTTEWIIRNCLVGITLLFLLVLILKKEQKPDLNWAIFYSTLWVLLSLLTVNWICIELGFWHFNEKQIIKGLMPYDLLFVWVIVWGTLVPFIFKGSKILITSIVLLWMDILFMPYLETLGIITLGKYWLVGEILLILFVFIPASFWSKLSLTRKHTGLRSLFQFISMGIIFCLGIPFITLIYFPQPLNFTMWYIPYVVQLGFIIVLPSIIALIDLYEKGNGTPFPFDPTTKIVRTGVYAYIRNPIQWSLTFFFIPLAIFYSSPILLIGLVVSVAYTLGVSNPQEFDAMEERFGVEWNKYKSTVPAWSFLWRPINIPKGTIYFKKNCNSCSSVRRWFERHKPFNLEFRHAEDYTEGVLLQVKYVDHLGREVSSVKAIANGLEHINLGWVTLGWFMRLPGINYIIQNIIDSMVFEESSAVCKSPTNNLNEQDKTPI
jgi:protein-S-isoprenylcysteine O-methyltransferase Ste14